MDTLMTYLELDSVVERQDHAKFSIVMEHGWEFLRNIYTTTEIRGSLLRHGFAQFDRYIPFRRYILPPSLGSKLTVPLLKYGSLNDPEDGESMFLQSVGTYYPTK
jgi:hypothetical protein